MVESEKNGGAVVRELYSAINRQDMDALASLFADDVIYADYGLEKTTTGKEEIKKHFKNWWTAFPKGSGRIMNLISVGDQVIAEIIGHGEQTGPFETIDGRIKASNLAFELHFCQIYHIKNGKIVKWHTYSDASKLTVRDLESKAA